YQWFTRPGHTANAYVSLINNGQIMNCSVLAGGFGYSSPPQVHFIDDYGTGAGGYVVVNNGIVTSIIMTNSGQAYGKYQSCPTVVIDPPIASVMAMLDQTNASLTLPTVTGADTADYFVVITNNFGSLTRRAPPCTLLLTPP